MHHHDVGRQDLTDDPQLERHAAWLWEQARAARAIVMKTLEDWGVPPDLNRLLTARLRKDLAQLETMQLLWEVQDVDRTAGDRQLVLVA